MIVAIASAAVGELLDTVVSKLAQIKKPVPTIL